MQQSDLIGVNLCEMKPSTPNHAGKKITMVFGASEDRKRYAFLAIIRLREHRYPVIAVGKKIGIAGDVDIVTEIPEDLDIDTVTLYLNPKNQEAWIDRILKLKPRRIIFNPGTENSQFAQLARNEGIIAEEACTLVMLASGLY
jgi:uncharacterized protein